MAEAATLAASQEDVQPRAPGEASWFWTLFTWCLVTFCLVLGALLCVLVGGTAALVGDRQRRVAHAMLAFAYRLIIRSHPTYRYSVGGTENLGGGPFILCPNHQSYSDVVYLFSLPGHYKWIVKRELFWVPLFGISMRVAGYPALRRGDTGSAHAVLEQVGRYLAAGVSVLNFPEGRRSSSGELGHFQTGAARMAILNQVPLVPVGVVGTARLLPRGSAMYPARAHLSIHVGAPIPTEGLTLRDLRPLTRLLREGVVAAKAKAQAVVDRGSGAVRGE